MNSAFVLYLMLFVLLTLFVKMILVLGDRIPTQISLCKMDLLVHTTVRFTEPTLEIPIILSDVFLVSSLSSLHSLPYLPISQSFFTVSLMIKQASFLQRTMEMWRYGHT